MRFEVKWSSDEDERLKSLHAQTEPKLSFSQIGREMDRGRNAVIGRAGRLHLPPREVHGGRPPNPNRPPRVRKPRLRLVKPKARPMLPKMPRGVIPPTIWKTLFDLEYGDCRFPLGDRDYVFCAMPAEEGKPYCECHCVKSYTKSLRAA